MQRENASICDVGDWEFVDPPALDEPDREAGRVVVGPSCATLLPGEPPHAAASRASPAAATIAAAIRAVGGHARRGRMTRLLSFSVHS
jgi:hypothetical protein